LWVVGRTYLPPPSVDGAQVTSAELLDGGGTVEGIKVGGDVERGLRPGGAHSVAGGIDQVAQGLAVGGGAAATVTTQSEQDQQPNSLATRLRAWTGRNLEGYQETVEMFQQSKTRC